MGVAKRSFSPSMMTGTHEKDFSDSEQSSSSLEMDRQGMSGSNENGDNVDVEKSMHG